MCIRDRTADGRRQCAHTALSLARAVKRKVVDWKKFKWGEFREESRTKLVEDLKKSWLEDVPKDCDEIVMEFTESILQCVEKIAVKKCLSVHGKPWINKQVS